MSDRDKIRITSTSSPIGSHPFVNLHILSFQLQCELTTYVERKTYSISLVTITFNPYRKSLVNLQRLKYLATYHAMTCIYTSGQHVI